VSIELLAALLAAVVAVSGWYATYFYTKRIEDNTRRLEAKLSHLERQIDELYGPLQALIEQIFTVWTVRENLLGDKSRLSPGDKEAARQLIWRDFFRPVHEQIQGLLRTRLHLVDGELPRSFQAYLEHSIQEAAQHALFEQLQISTSDANPKLWPDQFSEDVESSLDRLRKDYNEALLHLDTGSGIFAVAPKERRQSPELR
jgi:hypothetical protein